MLISNIQEHFVNNFLGMEHFLSRELFILGLKILNKNEGWFRSNISNYVHYYFLIAHFSEAGGVIN